MEINELRIGNYLLSKDEICIVSTINFDDTIRIFNDTKTETFGCFKLSIFEPIELTEEWLSHFWFKKNGTEYNLSLPLLSGVCLSIEENGQTSLIRANYCDGIELNSFDYVYIKPCKYVHELQNLYYSLTGIDLPIATKCS